MRLSIQALEPTRSTSYIAEHKVGEVVSGRVVAVLPVAPRSSWARAVTAFAALPQQQKQEASAGAGSRSVSMTAMLATKGKSGAGESSQHEGVRAGQIAVQDHSHSISKRKRSSRDAGLRPSAHIASAERRVGWGLPSSTPQMADRTAAREVHCMARVIEGSPPGKLDEAFARSHVAARRCQDDRRGFGALRQSSIHLPMTPLGSIATHRGQNRKRTLVVVQISVEQPGLGLRRDS